MNDFTPTTSDTPAAPTQVELYDDLRRIGELEDQKRTIQGEIDEKTEKLRTALNDVDPASLLHQVLSAALAPSAPARKASPTRKKTGTRKKTKKKSGRK